MRIKLDSGKEVSVDSFLFGGRTYGGVLSGLPNKKMNDSIFKEITYPSKWGPRKTLKIKPSDREFENRLKETYYSVWLNSNEPINPQLHGSELVVIWLDNYSKGKTIEEIILKGVKAINWEDNAQDYFY